MWLSTWVRQHFGRLYLRSDDNVVQIFQADQYSNENIKQMFVTYISIGTWVKTALIYL